MKHRTAVLIVLAMLAAAVAQGEWIEAEPKPGDSKAMADARLRLKNMQQFSRDHPAVREQLQKIRELEKADKK